MGGLSQEFAQHMTAPYYATVSEEVLFHVSTRMKCALNQKVSAIRGPGHGIMREASQGTSVK